MRASRALIIEFPESLPVSAQRQAIEAALRAHQVIVVCGETGSGKTTQLPKIALSLGRGRLHARPGERGRLIGHTQPRRIAASSVAGRIAQELGTALGEVVGYKVRFQDRLSPGASIKLMTDGILLAETQTDPLLQAYDTLIIDEAHERSLNIDFLLGYLRQILPRRPDLKVIITSATIDAERFARHFESAQGPAPVLNVEGRSFAVEQRYRPFEESRDYGLNEAIADAVDELWRGGALAGDVLVFLPGEREIRECADHLRQHLSHQPVLRSTEVLPLFARLSQGEQERIFRPSGARRIVLATNVAETSLTVPGIRYVIDSGRARVKRYSLRSKVEQLLVEPISQAAANQRAGRCGRVADGVCIRLYDEADYQGRPRFGDPEILRSSLAAVILRMKSLRLGAVEDFPFLEAPSQRAITDGYQLLQELGALDEGLQLTALGTELARLPLDPRVGRMILEARNRHALDEVLVLASALTVQDVRDRPLQAQAQADRAHAAFDDDKSEFVGYLKLWRWLEQARSGKPGPALADAGNATATAPAPQHKPSQRQYEALLRQHYLNPRRVREWRDIHSQLHTVVAEHGWKLNTAPASSEQLHMSLLAGLLGHVGCKHESEAHYQGARGIRYYPHPGAHLSKKPGHWIVCAELVETTRLFGRGIAAIDPQWLEQVGAHLLSKQVLDPRWEKNACRVVASERATLYGLLIYSQRRVDYARVDPAGARSIFIRQALVAALEDEVWPPEFERRLPFLAANRQVLAQVQALEHKSRRQDVLVDEELIYAFYDSQLPPDLSSGQELERWYRAQVRQQPELLRLKREELMRHQAAGVTSLAFPPTLALGGTECAASYLHQPGDARDGLSVALPIFVLNQASEERCEWLVPGMIKDKISALLKSLPQKPRARLLPLPETAAQLAAELSQPEHWAQGSLIEALLARVRTRTGLDVKRSDFKLDLLPAHHFMHLRVLDEHGRQLGQGRSLAALKAELGAQARGAFQALAGLQLAARAVAAGVGASTAEGVAAVPARVPPAGRSGASPAAAAPPARAQSGQRGQPAAPSAPAPAATERYRAWTFGDWPELMELASGDHSVIGFPALLDAGDAVSLAVYDEPEAAARQHRAGLRRLFALQLREALKQLEKSLPGLQQMAVSYLALGSLEELRGQIIEVALERAFMTEPWPRNAAEFQQRLDQGRSRLGLIAQEVARQAAAVLVEYAAVVRKLKEGKFEAQPLADAREQLQRLVGPRFLADTPWAALQHLPRYLKAIFLRLDKLRADPARDAAHMATVRAQEQRYARLLAERKGVHDARLDELRWLLEELRVSLFAQELRTPQPVSVKRLDKLWAQLVA
ncbi:MAG: ATP-dependent RNA helicase HrpA [Serpentinimonas sp.]|nr:ATP-dependent RNA helicase HrpA [Serpentinimonas sp.]